MKMRTILKISLSVILVVILVAGCSLGKSPAQKELDVAGAAWESAGIEDYRFKLRVSCFCPQEIVQPVLVSVLDGVAFDLIYFDTGEPVTTDYFSRVDTIIKLFDLIQEAIDNDADSLIVKYDALSGFPISISIDPIAQAVDEEVAYVVEDFTILK